MVNPVSEKALVVFGRLPLKGVVKTRLAAGIGEEAAFQLYETLLNHTLAEATKTSVPVYFFYEGELESGDAFPGIVLVKQSGNDFGQKLSWAAGYTMEQLGHDKIVIIGTDCPDLNAGILESAFETLDEWDLVIGKALDGGYYLIGLSDFHPELFQNVAWSTEKVASQTLANALNAGLKTEILPGILSDIDTMEDLTKYLKYPAHSLIYKQIEEKTRNARFERNG